MNKAALIVGSAPAQRASELYAALARAADIVIAADGGAAVCMRLGHTPDVVIGDMDSLDSADLDELEAQGVLIERFERKKDETDLELAISYAGTLNVDEITICACLSDRLDHTLAALGAAAATATSARICFAEPEIRAWVRDSVEFGSLRLKGKGSVVSVFGISDDARVTLTGFRYPLDGVDVGVFAPLGVSNELSDESAEVRIDRGRALILSPKVGNILPAEGA